MLKGMLINIMPQYQRFDNKLRKGKMGACICILVVQIKLHVQKEKEK
jgi:hypothetical protein